MGSPKRSRAAAVGFPDDPLTEILSRVHAKPLFRFKCVSKAWCSLIAYRLRGKKSPQTLEGFFFGPGGGGVNFGNFVSLSGRPVPFVDPSFSFLTKLPGINNLVLLSSHSGLLLFGHIRDCGTYGYLVCDPATEQCVAVPSSVWRVSPPVNNRWEYELDFTKDAHHVLIFDPAVSSHFYLVQFCHYRETKSVEAVFFNSSETGIWCRTPGVYHYGEGGETEIKSELGRADVNGILHFLAYKYIYRHNMAWVNKIIAVDVQGKIRRIIHWPDKNEFAVPVFIGQSQGQLHCISGHKTIEGSQVYITGLSIWILEDYEREQWVLKQTVSCSQLFGETSCGIDELHVAAIHPDCNLFFFVHHSDKKLISYDMDTKEVCALHALGHDCQSVIPYVPYFAESATLTTTH